MGQDRVGREQGIVCPVALRQWRQWMHLWQNLGTVCGCCSVPIFCHQSWIPGVAGLLNVLFSLSHSLPFVSIFGFWLQWEQKQLLTDCAAMFTNDRAAVVSRVLGQQQRSIHLQVGIGRHVDMYVCLYAL